MGENPGGRAAGFSTDRRPGWDLWEAFTQGHAPSQHSTPALSSLHSGKEQEPDQSPTSECWREKKETFAFQIGALRAEIQRQTGLYALTGYLGPLAPPWASGWPRSRPPSAEGEEQLCPPSGRCCGPEEQVREDPASEPKNRLK